MTDYSFDPSTPPTTFNSDNSVALDAGTAFVGMTINNTTAGGDAIRASGIQDITITPGVMIRGLGDAIEFAAAGTTASPNKIFNTGGLIWSGAGGAGINFSGGGEGQVLNQGSILGETGIKMTGTGRLEVFNSGMISTTDKAIVGSTGNDRVVNTGIIRTTSTPSTGIPVAIDLGAGDDIYDGAGGSVVGKIVLGTGADKAYGSSGSETFSGGAGNDIIDGGAGVDTVDYSDATIESGTTNKGINVDLRITTQQYVGGGHDSDTLTNIENIIGSAHNDSITGSSSDNSLEGGAGNDTLEGGLGNDTLDGGGDEDTVTYFGTASVQVDLNNTGAQNTLNYGMDVLKNIENVQGSNNADTISGSEGGNKLYGWTGADVLDGRGGNDTLDGGEGNDSLVGGAGLDSLVGGNGNDTLRGGDGNDTLEGGAGNDMAVFSGAKDDYIFGGTLTGAEDTTFTVKHKDLNDPASTLPGAGGEDTLKGVRLLKFLGATDAESDDVLYALTNSAVPANLTVTMASGTWISGGGIKENAPTDTIVGTLAATDADGDALTYTLADNPLFKLDGRTIKVKDGALLNFEALTNSVSYSYKLTVTVTDNIKNYSDGAMVGTATRDVYITITNDMNETANVIRYGTTAGEQAIGEYGNDIVYGRSGDDQVFGRKGNDKLYGDDGNDYVLGGDGTQGTALIDTGNDTLYGGNGADMMWGGDGNDFLYGGNGKDTLYGGEGSDVFVFDVKPNVSTNLDFIADFNPTYDTIKLSQVAFSKIAKGTLKAGAFVVGTAFKQADDRILYHKTAGALFYDPDGSGAAKAIQFANIGKNLALTYHDFIIF